MTMERFYKKKLAKFIPRVSEIAKNVFSKSKAK